MNDVLVTFEMMKATVLLVVVLLITAEVTANPALFRVFVALGMKLVKNMHYARCNTRNVPAGEF